MTTKKKGATYDPSKVTIRIDGKEYRDLKSFSVQPPARVCKQCEYPVRAPAEFCSHWCLYRFKHRIGQ